VKVLTWQPRRPPQTPLREPAVRFPAIGEYAGRARYAPKETSWLSRPMRQAIGRVVEVCFMGLAPAGPWAGQSLYQVCRGQELPGASLILEHDLNFID
jgi:hypothetical protein